MDATQDVLVMGGKVMVIKLRLLEIVDLAWAEDSVVIFIYSWRDC